MNIVFESELMENQKHAVVMAPDLAFEVLQSLDGDALFFSIGTDKILYLTREVTQTSTGWNKLDLSSVLLSQHGTAPVTAKMFRVAQNAHTLAIDLALVLTVRGADLLYLSLGNANTDTAWASGVTWTPIPFDAGTAPNPLTISDVFLMNIPAADGTGAVESIFVDILSTPDDPQQLLDRYYIIPKESPQWKQHDLGADLAAGSISSCLGKRTNDPVPGIYTFGRISNEQELIFRPQYNYFTPGSAPHLTRLGLPTGASAIASAFNGSGVSNLFLAATGGLFLYTPANQQAQANAVQIVSNSLFAGVSALAAATDANRTTVWGLNPQGNLFYVTCPAGNEADSTAWSNPVPLLAGVEGFAFFLNLNTSNNVLFAHVDGQSLIQLTQDPVTTIWLQRSILLPPTTPNDVAVYNSFTTHIKITDDNGVGAPNAAIAVTATSPVSVYLNDMYHQLSPSLAVSTTADATGILTIVQETQSLAAVCLRVVLTDTPEVVADINPMSKALATLKTIQNGNDLGDVQVTNADGTQQPLVSANVSSDDKDAVAKSIAQLVMINTGLPQNGSRQGSADVSGPIGATTPVPVWGVSFANGGFEYHEGDDTAQHLGLPTVAAGSPLGTGNPISVAPGDFFEWIKQIVDHVDSFVVQVEKDLYHFMTTIGDKVYDVRLDCTDAVVHAVELVLNKIKVSFEDLIKWLGFLFAWSDILRTHLVLKNIFNQHLVKCINGLSDTRTQLQQTFTKVESYVANWGGISSDIPPSLSGTTLGTTTRSSKPAPGQDSPQSNWALYHLKSNAASGNTTAQPNQGVIGNIASVLGPLAQAVEQEKGILQEACDDFKSQIIDQIHDLSFTQLIEGVCAIIGETLLKSIESVLLAAIDALSALTAGMIEGLNATIEIPVISWLYKKVANNDLSLLDLPCLITAIPVTIGYKLIADAPPFPDNPTTTALINAPDFASIQSICNPANTLSTRVPEAPVLAASTSTSVNDILALTGGILASHGALLQSLFSPLKQKFPDLKVLTVISDLSCFPYVAPNIMKEITDWQSNKWWIPIDAACTAHVIVKSLTDMFIILESDDTEDDWNSVSSWMDCAGSVLWEVSTIAAKLDPENQNTAGELSFYGGTCFNLNGVMSPLLTASANKNPQVWVALVVVSTILNLAYGALSCAAGILTLES